MHRNDELDVDDALALEPDGVLLSPGPGRPEDAGIICAAVPAFADRGIPVLGVCLGHQAIGHVYGATHRRRGRADARQDVDDRARRARASSPACRRRSPPPATTRSPSRRTACPTVSRSRRRPPTARSWASATASTTSRASSSIPRASSPRPATTCCATSSPAIGRRPRADGTAGARRGRGVASWWWSSWSSSWSAVAVVVGGAVVVGAGGLPDDELDGRPAGARLSGARLWGRRARRWGRRPAGLDGHADVELRPSSSRADCLGRADHVRDRHPRRPPETISVTSPPRSTSVPAAGSVRITSPAGPFALLGDRRTLNPYGSLSSTGGPRPRAGRRRSTASRPVRAGGHDDVDRVSCSTWAPAAGSVRMTVPASISSLARSSRCRCGSRRPRGSPGLVERLALDVGHLVQLRVRVEEEPDHLGLDDHRAGRGVGAVDDVSPAPSSSPRRSARS